MSGVAGVHSLHIWSLTMDKNVVSVHLSVGMYVVTLCTQLVVLNANSSSDACIHVLKASVVQEI